MADDYRKASSSPPPRQTGDGAKHKPEPTVQPEQARPRDKGDRFHIRADAPVGSD
jgi:hypothetical protein